MEKSYKPNVGPLFWVHIILILVIIIPILIVLVILKKSPALVSIPILVIVLLIVLISLLVLARTKYDLDDENIKIQTAFKKLDIPYGSVTSVVDTNKWQAGEGMLVLSSDRIGILFGEGGKASISPRDKPDALETLRSCCPEAVFTEDLKVKNTSVGKTEAPAEDAVAETEGSAAEEPAMEEPSAEYVDEPETEDPAIEYNDEVSEE